MKLALLACLLVVITSAVFAADGKPVSYQSGSETVNGILYTPPGKGPFPALVVIHEWWGLNDWVKEEASKLADQGYVALAVDLVSRQGGNHSRRSSPDHAGRAGRPRQSRSVGGQRLSSGAEKRRSRSGSVPSDGAWAAAIRLTWRLPILR